MNKKFLGGASVLAAAVAGTGVYLAVPAVAGPSHDTAAVTAAATRSPGTGDKAARRPGRRIRRLRRAARGVHGQATVRTKKGFAQVAWQRGKLTATSGGTLTVRSLDGVTWQWATDAKTRVRKDGQRSSVGKLAAGDYVAVFGPLGGTTRTARVVVVPKRVPAKATQSPAPAHT